MARRTGLGKGLDALIPSAGPADRLPEGVQLQEISLGQIVTNPHQPRKLFDDEHLASLAASIREVGILQPVLVRRKGTQYELIAGERRLRAAHAAGLTSVPAVVRNVDDSSSMAQALIENLHREDLNPLEEAAAYQELISTHGWTHEQVAAKVGKSRTAISNTLRLMRLPGEVQRLLAQGRLGEGHARAVLALDDVQAQVSLAAHAAEHELSVRQVEALARDGGVKQKGAASRSSARPTKPTGHIEVETRLAELLDTKVAVKGGTKRGRIEITFAGDEDLARIFDQLTGQ